MARKSSSNRSQGPSKRDGVNITSQGEFRPNFIIKSREYDPFNSPDYLAWRDWIRSHTFEKSPDSDILQGDRRREENKDRFLLRSGLRAPIVLRRSTKMGRPYRLRDARLGFQFPGHTMVCKRRKDRRRAVFAWSRLIKRGIGSGGGKNMRRIMRGISRGRHLWNEASHITC